MMSMTSIRDFDDARDAVMTGPRIIEQFRNELGLATSAEPPRSYEEMKLDAYAEKYPQLRESHRIDEPDLETAPQNPHAN